jgi:outer membrane protein OmpA-like peptidoglycan-associated protein
MKFHPMLLLVVMLTLQLATSAQVSTELEKGDKAFDNFDLTEALYFFEVANDAQPNDPTITRRIAKTYQRMGQVNIAAEWFRKTLELDASNAADMLNYAQALKSLGQYDEAVHWFELFNTLKPNDLRAQSHLRDKEYYRDLFADTARYTLKRFAFNNAYPVIGVSLFENEKLLVSTIGLGQSGKDQTEQYLDIYQVDLNSANEIVNPVLLNKNVNSKYHDGPAFYSFSDHTLYITRNNMRGNKPVKDKKGLINLKIYSSTYSNGEWSSAQSLKFNKDDYSNAYPCLSKDGQTMYFVSNRDGGVGGTDLYMCTRQGSGWSEPVNLGRGVNTEGDERFPYIGDDGYLYYSSDGWAGLGGLDVFSAEFLDGKWLNPVNLGAPINSTSDDFSILYDKEKDNGFFCSNRYGNGDDDLLFYKHVSIDKLIIAGTIKANVPNVSLAGERIQIKKLNTGETSEDKLDDMERFEFSADPGDKIEITMMDAEYFDSAPVVSYQVGTPILDPFVNVGENKIELKKIPTHTGPLNNSRNATLAVAKPTLLTQIKNNEGASMPGTDMLSDTNSNSGVQNTDGSGLNSKTPDAVSNAVDGAATDLNNAGSSGTNATTQTTKTDETTNPSTPVTQAYKDKIAQADRLLSEGKLEDARNAYINATAAMPSMSYPKDQIAKVNEQIADKAKKEKDFNDYTVRADGFYSTGKWADAKKFYEQALTVFPMDKYAKDQLAKVEQEITKAANKPKSEFEKGVPVIDLEGMNINNVSFDYNRAVLRPEDMKTMEQLYKVMKENPNTKLLIRAYCDSRGSATYNQSLSMSRAMAVQGYLMQRGIKRDRMIAEWYGEERPLNGCIDGVPCEEDQYEVNRRAEFKLVANVKETP